MTKSQGHVRYGLSVLSGEIKPQIVAWKEVNGQLLPVSDEELKDEAPEWFTALAVCRGELRVLETASQLPLEVQTATHDTLGVLVAAYGSVLPETESAGKPR